MTVILRSKATKNPKPLRDCCAYILTNETHSLYVESESRMWVDLSAGWSEVLDSSLRSERQRGAESVILRSKATKNPKPLCEYYVYILTNETHSLHIESERPMWVDLSGRRLWILHCVQNDRRASGVSPPLLCRREAVGSRLHGSDDCAVHVAGGDAVCFNWAVMTNTLYYGDNLDILREHVPDESVDLVYLDPPFNSNASYNVLFKEQSGEESPAQIRAY